jgi:hypothetical protein
MLATKFYTKFPKIFRAILRVASSTVNEGDRLNRTSNSSGIRRLRKRVSRFLVLHA